MRRREFLFVAAAWPLAARAQEKRIPRIGVIDTGSTEVHKPGDAAFEAGLEELGYIAGKSVNIEYRYSGSRDERLPQLARELVSLHCDVIVAGGVGVPAAHAATRAIPIVAVNAGDLVAMHLAESLAHPGGNVTGQSIFILELIVKRAELLKRVKPAIKNVGLLFPQNLRNAQSYLENVYRPVRTLGLEPSLIEVASPDDCSRVLTTGPGASVDGLVVLDHPMFITPPGAAVVADAAARRGLPTAVDAFGARAGGYLLGFGVDYFAMWRRAAVFVDQILKGAKPGDIPIQRATKFITTVNLKTAKTLGLEIPPTLLAAADEVIE